MLIGITDAKQQLVDQFAKRGVAATFRIRLGGRFAHAMTGDAVARRPVSVRGAAQMLALVAI